MGDRSSIIIRQRSCDDKGIEITGTGQVRK